VIEQDPTAGSKAADGSTVTITVATGLGKAIVPDVKGMDLAGARKEIEDAGFKTEVTQEHSNRARNGTVIGTVPPAGTHLERKETVTIQVSSGPRLVSVPSVVGLDQGTADARIRDAGLLPRFQRQESSQPDGQVIDQSPDPGSSARRHTAVTVIVSSGIARVTVPNVVGEPEDQARADLSSAGLGARAVTQTTNDPSGDGKVLNQSPQAGAKLPRGEAVTIFVGKFKEPPTTTTTEPPTTTTSTTTGG
jgi:serine/threonine-protein kinase